MLLQGGPHFIQGGSQLLQGESHFIQGGSQLLQAGGNSHYLEWVSSPSGGTSQCLGWAYAPSGGTSLHPGWVSAPSGGTSHRLYIKLLVLIGFYLHFPLISGIYKLNLINASLHTFQLSPCFISFIIVIHFTLTTKICKKTEFI